MHKILGALLLPLLFSHVPAANSENLCPQGISIEQVPLKKLKEYRVELRLAENVVVQLVERAVVVDEKRRDYCKDFTVGLVNGTTPFGATGNPPTPYSYLAKLTLRAEGKSYDLETTNMYNALGGRPLEYSADYNGRKYMAAHCYDSGSCVLRGIFSGQGGLYVAEWLISNGKPFRSILSPSTDVTDFFMEGGVNPPVFE
ncbi:MAG: hypothetical protein AABY83_00330 [Pseudomonadota bacterium]